jgi:transketolase
MTALYFHGLNIDAERPDWHERDRFVLSKGHACLALYVTLYHAGFYGVDKLNTYLQPNTGLPGHPMHGGAPGIEVSTGSLGHGMSVSVGLALGAKMDARKYRVFAVVGDGESNEGMVWEAAMCAANFELDNLIVVLDRNKYQCSGSSDQIMKLEPVQNKWESFGWEVRNCDGHNMAELVELMGQLPFASGKPSLILANTVKGNGVPFMENNPDWHYRAPSAEELESAIGCLAANCGSGNE